MDQTFLLQLNRWNEEEEYQKIIEAVEALPEEEKTPVLISEMACAYNNLAEADDSRLFEKAAELLESVEEELSADHRWNFRMGYACYYLNREKKAKHYFEKALEALPGDEDTLYFIKECERCLALPISMKPFRQRVKEGWDSFLAGEAGLREQIERREHGEEVAAALSRLLAPAFRNICFEIGFNGEKYDLILTPDGDRAKILKLVYFKDHAPEEVFHHWNIQIGRQPAKEFELSMYGQSIGTKDAFVWVEELDDDQIGLSVFCEKLLTLLEENEDRAYSLMAVLLDQAIGEIPAIRYIGYMDLLKEPKDGGDAILLDELKGCIDGKRAVTPENLCGWYTCYSMEPDGREDWFLREDTIAGVTTCPEAVGCYFRGDDRIMEEFHQDGAVPGFFYYPLEGIERGTILDMRDSLEKDISDRAGDAVTFTGGATGTDYGYLDFAAWDLDRLLKSAMAVFNERKLEAAFHTFRRDVSGVALSRKGDKE